MSNQSRGSTRLALIDAGMRLFGEFGYDATSTRQVAQAAGANISAISYYFGGKKGLRLACAEHIAEHLAMAVSGLEKIDDMSPEYAASKLEQVLSEFVHILPEQSQGKEMAQFMLKEVAQVSEVLDLVFPKFIAPVHESVCLLWAKATGQYASSSDVILTVFFTVRTGHIFQGRSGNCSPAYGLGYAFSTFATTQMQAMQLTFFYFLPSLLLSGFMFPFRGMPVWAQYIGEMFPLTHFLRIIRAVMLKEANLEAVSTPMAAMLLFTFGFGLLALLRFRRTLD